MSDVYSKIWKVGKEIVKESIKVELVYTSQSWIARVAGVEDYESEPYPTAHQALEEVAGLLRQFWDAFSVFTKPDF